MGVASSVVALSNRWQCRAEVAHPLEDGLEMSFRNA